MRRQSGGRTIAELITAVAAGEAITAEEERRLHQRRRRERHWPYLVAGFGASRAVQQMRTDIVRDLRRYTLPQCRYRIRELLHLLEEFAAVLDGKGRVARKQRRSGGDQSGESRRDARAELLRTFDVIKADHPTLTESAIARLYLSETDGWLSATDSERPRKVRALIRRVQIARKKLQKIRK